MIFFEITKCKLQNNMFTELLEFQKNYVIQIKKLRFSFSKKKIVVTISKRRFSIVAFLQKYEQNRKKLRVFRIKEFH